ncbi:hypothetical protein FRC17_006503, partial [Serendipita sp. 399]
MLTIGEQQSTSEQPAIASLTANEATIISPAVPKFGIRDGDATANGTIIGTTVADLPYLPLVDPRQDTINNDGFDMFRQALVILILRSSFWIDQKPEPK